MARLVSVALLWVALAGLAAAAIAAFIKSASR